MHAFIDHLFDEEMPVTMLLGAETAAQDWGIGGRDGDLGQAHSVAPSAPSQLAMLATSVQPSQHLPLGCYPQDYTRDLVDLMANTAKQASSLSTSLGARSEKSNRKSLRIFQEKWKGEFLGRVSSSADDEDAEGSGTWSDRQGGELSQSLDATEEGGEEREVQEEVQVESPVGVEEAEELEGLQGGIGIVQAEASLLGEEWNVQTAREEFAEYMGTHAAFQLERIILEEQLSQTVDSLVAEFAVRREGPEGPGGAGSEAHALTDKGSRWWSQSITTGLSPSGFTRIEHEFSASSAPLPFDQEEAWYVAMERGDDVDAADMSVSDTLEAILEVGEGDNSRAIVGDVRHVRTATGTCTTASALRAIAARRPPVRVQQARSLYLALQGYADRRLEIVSAVEAIAEGAAALAVAEEEESRQFLAAGTAAAVSPAEASGTGTRRGGGGGVDSIGAETGTGVGGALRGPEISRTPALIHWWPWLYEVLVNEWLALLDMFHVADDSDRSLPRGGRTGLPPQVTPASAAPYATHVYPFALDSVPRDSTWAHKDTRSLALDHAPALLKLVMKSLIMRIAAEGKKGPVILDAQFICVLDCLVAALCLEMVHKVML